MKNKAKSYNTSPRAQMFLEMFSKEHPAIREEIATALPAYNKLLSLHAKTFEEFALIPLARKQNDDYEDPLYLFPEHVKPLCPKCKDDNKVSRRNENEYICRKCNKVFAANHDSISSGSKCTSIQWMQFVHCLLNYDTVDDTRKHCGDIAIETYYLIRTKIFYAMSLLMDEVKLYGNIYGDNTYAHTSFKGTTLIDREYPEGSMFDISKFMPRTTRKRGGSYPNHLKNVNNICIFAAIDDYNHVVVRYVGLGNATATKLERAVPADKFLFKVPAKDPFSFAPPVENKPKTSNSVFVFDKETTLQKYAENIGMKLESHVYRKNGIQLRLPEGSHNIQKVNALHSRLKKFLMMTNNVSSKYLPGYLTLFEFIENTRASEKAIGRLFEILSTPGLGQKKEFFDGLFEAPNYLIEWDEDNTLLKKLTYNQLLAAYMYHQNQLDIKARKSPTYIMQDILEETGYQSPSTVRRIYKNLVASNVIDKVYNKMSAKVKLIKTNKKIKPNNSVKIDEKKMALMLNCYDVLCKMYTGPYEQRTSDTNVYMAFNKQYGTKHSRPLFIYYMNHIEEQRLRETKLSELKIQAKLNKPPNLTYYYAVKEKYQQLSNEGIEATLPDIYRMVSKERGVSHEFVQKSFKAGQEYIKAKENK